MHGKICIKNTEQCHGNVCLKMQFFMLKMVLKLVLILPNGFKMHLMIFQNTPSRFMAPTNNHYKKVMF